MVAVAETNLYETDFIAWAEAQAAALRARPELADLGLDLPNLIEELESLARRDLIKLEDRLRCGLIRLIIAGHHPDPDRARAELAGAGRPLIDARAWRSPTGLSRLDLERLWSEAWEEAAASLPDESVPGEPGPCPFRAEELLVRGFSPRDGLARVRRSPEDEVEGPSLSGKPAAG